MQRQGKQQGRFFSPPLDEVAAPAGMAEAVGAVSPSLGAAKGLRFPLPPPPRATALTVWGSTAPALEAALSLPCCCCCLRPRVLTMCSTGLP
jgi:hypothetical protein